MTYNPRTQEEIVARMSERRMHVQIQEGACPAK